jgi:prepilin-type N-terminal cleavage/methylation domain-containing protein
VTPSPARSRSAGFTLFEMLVTVAIMALIAGLAFPALQHQLARRALLDARMAVAMSLALARADAIAHNAPTRVALSQDRASLAFSDGRAPIALPWGALVEWPRDGVTFYGDGSASPATGAITVGPVSSHFAIEPGRGQIGFAP